MKQRLLILLLIVIVSAGMFTGCSNMEKESIKDASGEKTLVFGSVGYFCNEAWDTASGWEGWYIGSYGVSECLFRLNDAFEAQPWLVESYSTGDNKTWKLRLREDVLFHNGTKMTADAVKKCFERTLKVNGRAAEVLPVERLEAEGQILTIKLKELNTTLPNDLCDPLWTVYDAERSTDFAQKTYFTGPYIPTEFNPNIELTVVKNEQYWGDTPKLDKAIFKTITDVDALTMAFQNGEIDILVPVPETSMPIIQRDSRLTIDGKISMRVQFIRFNMNSPVFQDAAVRNAISYCIDRESYAQVICGNTTAASYGVFPEYLPYGGIKGIDSAVERFDPEKAKQILVNAGYMDTNGDGILEKDGRELSFKMIGLSTQKDILELSQVLQSQLSEIGITLKVETMENISDARRSGQFDLSYESYSMGGTGNPQGFIDFMFTTGGSNNFGKYSNAEVDMLARKLRETADEEEKNQIIRSITQHILDDVPFIFFAHKKFTCAYNTDTVAYYHTQPSEFYILDSSVEAK
ncbi:ABC transporter substrate-binding protein [Geosporobacter ferrireducens]|uniref:ABC transporter substrate-binding protein n=1 Tax=Geosporobacter ferrireducens TaxID=1424294 RepID=UPI00139DAA7C|nr:ABC transporter substrate-binding protein [Geosporobacter ferrireducens]MTI58221.1 ABC transporter substrate-binding protein [Geosporobacter ferrireducens]